jgi:hypothetical protein
MTMIVRFPILIMLTIGAVSCGQRPIATRDGVDILSSDVESKGISGGLKYAKFEWTVKLRNRTDKEQYVSAELQGCTQGGLILHRNYMEVAVPAGDELTHVYDAILVEPSKASRITQWLLNAPAFGL